MVSPKSSLGEGFVQEQEIQSTVSRELEGKVDQDIPGESMRSENSDELGDDDMMLCKAMKAEAFGCCSELESQVTANENPE